MKGDKMEKKMTPEQNLMHAIFGQEIKESVDRCMEHIRKIEGACGHYHPTPNYKGIKKRRERINRRTLAEKYHFQINQK